jgi:hypothetical protein
MGKDRFSLVVSVLALMVGASGCALEVEGPGSGTYGGATWSRDGQVSHVPQTQRVPDLAYYTRKAQEDLEFARNGLNNARAELDAREAEANAATSQADAAAAELAAITTQLETARRALVDINRPLPRNISAAERRRRTTSQRTESTRLSQEILALEARQQPAQAKLDQARARMVAANTALDAAGARMGESMRVMADAEYALQSAYDRADRELAERQRRLEIQRRQARAEQAAQTAYLFNQIVNLQAELAWQRHAWEQERREREWAERQWRERRDWRDTRRDDDRRRHAQPPREQASIVPPPLAIVPVAPPAAPPVAPPVVTPQQPDRPDRPDRPNRGDRPDRPDRPERPDRPDRTEQPRLNAGNDAVVPPTAAQPAPVAPDRPDRPERPRREVLPPRHNRLLLLSMPNQLHRKWKYNW